MRARLATQLLHREHKLGFVGMAVAHRGQDRLVACEALGKSNVFGVAIEVRARGMSQTMKRVPTLEARTLLPGGKEMPHLASRQALAAPTDKKRCRSVDALALPALPHQELRELEARYLVERHFLRGGRLARPLEDSQHQAASNSTVLIDDVTHVERHEFMLAQAGAQGQREQEVFTKGAASLATRFEQRALLTWIECLGG